MQTRIVMSYCATNLPCTLFILFHKSTAVTCSVEASIVVLGYSKLAPVGEELTYKIMFKDKDLVVQYLKLHRGPKPSDQLYAPFKDIG